MLFLFNDRLLNLGVVVPALGGQQLGAAIRAGKDAIFAAGEASALHPDVLTDVATQIAAASRANAALIVRPPKAKRPDDVGFRLAEVALPTMAFLATRATSDGALPASFVNQSVWMVAANAPKP